MLRPATFSKIILTIICYLVLLIDVNGQVAPNAQPKVINSTNPTAAFTVNPVGNNQALVILSWGNVTGITYGDTPVNLYESIGVNFQIWTLPLGTNIGGTKELKIKCNGFGGIVVNAFGNVDQQNPIGDFSAAYIKDGTSSSMAYESIEGDGILDILAMEDCPESVAAGDGQKLLGIFCPEFTYATSFKNSTVSDNHVSWQLRHVRQGMDMAHVYIVLNQGPDTASLTSAAPLISDMLAVIIVAIGLLLIFIAVQKVPQLAIFHRKAEAL